MTIRRELFAGEMLYQQGDASDCAWLIEQGTNLPISVTKDGYDNPGPVPEVEVRIYQGEHRLAYDNTLIEIAVSRTLRDIAEGAFPAS